ncbi:MAG: hypothetical protein Q4E22_04475 [Coriobacteriia bacterium]|nr:hypothetical protein [Coriobacteriia bacterium]
MDSKKIAWSRVLRLAGAITAYLIGSGYATGQEISQFFTAYGPWGIVSGLLIAIFYAIMVAIVIGYGYDHRHSPVQGAKTQAFTYFTGKIYGTFLQWFIPFFLYLVFIAMVAGAGATIAQYFALPQWVGSSIMVLLCFIVAILGLNKLVDLISWVGPLAIFMTIIIALYAIISNPSSLSEIGKNQDILAEMPRAVDNTSLWLFAGFLYMTYNYLGTVPFFVEAARFTDSKKESILGGVIGIVFLMGAVILLVVAQLAYLPHVAGLDVPNLFLSDLIHPAASIVLILCILGAVFSTAAPMLWTAATRIAPQGTRANKITLLVLSIIGLFAGNLPYGVLIGTIYPYTGYISMFAIALILIKFIRTRGKTQDLEE